MNALSSDKQAVAVDLTGHLSRPPDICLGGGGAENARLEIARLENTGLEKA